MINLYNKDCLPAMREMRDNEYQLAIIDPPYMDENKALQSNGPHRTKYNIKTLIKPDAEYFNELFRVSKNQIIWGGNYFSLPISRGWICWDKKEGGYNFSQFELAWTSFDMVAKIYRQSNHGGFVAKGIDKKIHVTQKPVGLYKYLLHNYAKEGDKILDTHFGSLSIGIACHDYGFDLDAYEIDKDYFEAAKKRLEIHQAQGKLF